MKIRDYAVPETLGGLKNEGLHLKALCKSCRRELSLLLDPLIAEHGEQKSWRAFKGRCQECGSTMTGIDVMIPFSKFIEREQ